MTEKFDAAGNINVKMGNGNTVGQIGHNFYIDGPPPAHNAVLQHEKVVGEFNGEPEFTGDRVVLPELVFFGPPPTGGPISLLGSDFFVVSYSAKIVSKMAGFGIRHCFSNAECEIVR